LHRANSQPSSGRKTADPYKLLAFTQHPEMWNAAVIQMPLLDVLGV